MCGRFTLIRLADFTDMFPWIRAPESQPPPPRFNIAPSQAIAAVRNEPEPTIELLHWGLIPSWAKDPAIGNRMINARSETLAQKPAFRAALRRRRCVIPASGSYEWKKSGGGARTPMYITRKSGRLMPLAGLWDVWHDDGGAEIRSCTIITVPANEMVADIHDRMPAILRDEDVRPWLQDGEVQPEEVLELLRPYSAEDLTATPVSRAVNNAKNDSAECIEATAVPTPPAPARAPRRRKRGTDESTGSLFG